MAAVADGEGQDLRTAVTLPWEAVAGLGVGVPAEDGENAVEAAVHLKEEAEEEEALEI